MRRTGAAMSSRRPEGSPISPALARAWRRSGPSTARLAQAYTHFLGRGASRSRGMGTVVVWLLAGMLLGMGSLFAATAIPRLLPGAGGTKSPSGVQPRPNEKEVSRAYGARPRTTASAAEPVTSSNAPVPSAAPETPLRAFSAAERESWQRVAGALRNSDLEEADAALLKLARQGSEADREVARLVRAQVLLRQGRELEARAVLQALSQPGISEATRRKAASLLERTVPVTPPHRSFELEPSTKGP